MSYKWFLYHHVSCWLALNTCERAYYELLCHDNVILLSSLNTSHGCSVLISGMTLFGTTLAIALGGIVASRQLHADLLHSVLHSPMSFFEVTPSGNLLNRFSKEIDAIDCMIPDGLKMMLGYLFKLLEVCIILLLATPFTGLVIPPLIFVYIFIQVTVSSECLSRHHVRLMTLCKQHWLLVSRVST